MLKKNVIKEARAMRETDIGVWVTSLMLLFLALFAVVCLYAGINNYKCIQSYTRSNLICYSGTASDIVGATGRSGKVSWRGPNTYIITLDNSDTVFFDCSPFDEYGLLPNDIQISRKYDWYYTESCSFGHHHLVSIADEGFDEAQFDCVSRFVKRQAWIPLCAGGFFVLLAVADFGALIQAIIVGAGFESRKQREKRIAEEKRKAERRAKYLEERERLRAEKQKKKH